MSSFSTTENARSAADPLAEADALIEQGRADEAVALLDSVYAARRGGLLLAASRVKAYIASGAPETALAIARETALLYAGVAQVAVMLGEALLATSHPAGAIGECQRALRLNPDNVAARYALGLAWLEAGEADKAADAFAAIDPAEAPADLAARVAEIAAMRARSRSDPRYVRHLFDQFSADYDSRMLGQLAYGAPQILQSLAGLIGLDGKLAVLDLGCGTGLSGAAFADLASRLDGIDLSPAMIGKAQARGIYDDLATGDIETALRTDGRCYDLVIAADTLVYLGDLAALFASVAARLVDGGHFLFTVERCGDAEFELGPKRRWRHSENYLRARAEEAGFAVAGFLECSPRTEAGVPVAGYAVALRREPGGTS